MRLKAALGQTLVTLSPHLSVTSCPKCSTVSIPWHHSHIPINRKVLPMQKNWQVQSSSCTCGTAQASKHGTDEHKCTRAHASSTMPVSLVLVWKSRHLDFSNGKLDYPWQWQMMLFVATKCTIRANWCLSCMCCTYPTCADTGKLSSLPLVLHPPLICCLWHFVCTCLIQKEGIYIISEKLYCWQVKVKHLALRNTPPQSRLLFGPAGSVVAAEPFPPTRSPANPGATMHPWGIPALYWACK